MNTEQTSRRRGFAALDPDKRKEMASRGGHAAHAQGAAHHFTHDEAREAGRKGGERVSRDRAHMARIGRLGGQRSHARKRAEENAATTAPKEDEAKTEKAEAIGTPEPEGTPET